MKVDIDPIWPWSDLRQLFGELDSTTGLAIGLVGLLVLAAPLALRRIHQQQQRPALIGLGAVILGLLTWVAFCRTSAASLSFGERLGNASLLLLLLIPLGMIGWMLRTYAQTPGLSRRRFVVVLVLRLAAVLCAVAAVVRPHLGFLNPLRGGLGVLKIVVDSTQSMSIQDEAGQARWDVLLRALKECQPLLSRLRGEQGLEVEFFRFGYETSAWDPEQPGQPIDKRTDIGGMLDSLYLNQDRRPVRGIILLSDGRNNATGRITPFAAARKWRGRTRLHTVLLGNPTTPYGLRDITVTRVTPVNSLVQARTNMVFQTQIDAPGFEGSKVRIRVLVKGSKDDKPIDRTGEAKIERVQTEPNEQNDKDHQIITLKESRNNEVRIRLPAPTERGDYTVTVRAEDPQHPGQALPGEVNKANNEASTLISVIPGGIRVLLIDRPRAWEPQMIYDVLRADSRINARVVWLGGNRPVEADLFQFASQQYDVILLGDVTAKQIEQVQPNAVKEIAELVNKGSGLIMLGGYASFGNEDWKGTALDVLLPVDLNQSKGLNDKPIRMMPTDRGRRLLSLANGDAASEEKAWKALPSLDQGIWKIIPRGGQLDNILATSLAGDAILVSQNFGKGRVLAFAVDTTYFWRDNAEGVQKHARFWRQIIAWLAHLENNSGNIWVRPDQRDVAEGTELGFSVGARGKGGQDLDNGVFEVDIETPNKKVVRVNTARQGTEERGSFKPSEPGEYVIRVKGKAKDPEGDVINDTAEAHFLVHQEDVEMADWAADKGLMEKLAREGRGRAIGISQLPDLLRDYVTNPPEDGKTRVVSWPNWRSRERSGFLPLFFLLFVMLLATEWFLRRRWGII